MPHSYEMRYQDFPHLLTHSSSRAQSEDTHTWAQAQAY